MIEREALQVTDGRRTRLVPLTACDGCAAACAARRSVPVGGRRIVIRLPGATLLGTTGVVYGVPLVALIATVAGLEWLQVSAHPLSALILLLALVGGAALLVNMCGGTLEHVVARHMRAASRKTGTENRLGKQV